MVSRIIITTLVSTYLRYMVVQVTGYGGRRPRSLPAVRGGAVLSPGDVHVRNRQRDLFFPYLILVRTFDQPSNAFVIVLWPTLGVFGDN